MVPRMGQGGIVCKKQALGCTNPYKVNINAPSFSGVAVERLLRNQTQNVTTCEALFRPLQFEGMLTRERLW